MAKILLLAIIYVTVFMLTFYICDIRNLLSTFRFCHYLYSHITDVLLNILINSVYVFIIIMKITYMYFKGIQCFHYIFFIFPPILEYIRNVR